MGTLEQIMSLRGHGHSHGHAVPTAEPLPPPVPNTPSSSRCRRGGGVDESQSFLSDDSGHPIFNNHNHLQIQPQNTDSGCADEERSVSIKKPSRTIISSTNMMVIIGDAVHNFADGVAIGAAFSMGYATGLSTSIAVLCHELPHEIGDFAILIQNGMKTRTALFFNLISSITGVIGMCLGLLLGTAGNFSSWLIAGIVGVFLYVALVSMIPQLKAKSFCDVVINVSGILVGSALLLVIGLYEESLINLFSSS